MGGFSFGSRCSLFVATQATVAAFSLRTFAKQSDEYHSLILPSPPTFFINFPTVQCPDILLEPRKNTRANFRCISGHWFPSDSLWALPKPANGQPVGSQIFKPPTPDLRGMPLRQAQTNGVCLNQ